MISLQVLYAERTKIWKRWFSRKSWGVGGVIWEYLSSENVPGILHSFQTFSSPFHNSFPSVLPAAVQMPLLEKAGKYLDCNSMENAGVERMVRPHSTNMERPSHQSVSKSWLNQSCLVISIKKWNVLELKALTTSTD